MIILPTLHPGLLARQGDEDGFSKYEHIVVADLRRGKRLMSSRPTWDESIIFETDSVGRPWRLFPTVSEVDWFFRRFTDACIRHPQAVKEGYLSLTTDVETTKDAPLLSQLINVGFGFRAPDEEQVINIPILCCGGGRYWTANDEIYVRRLLQRQLARVDICVQFHNKGFDKAVLWAQGMPVLGWSWCCYVNSQTEFLTDRGWLRYDEITEADRLGTIRSKTGEFEFQCFTHRIDTPFSGEAFVFETQKSKAVVSSNHRMLTQPVARTSGRVGEWGFSRAEQVIAEAPDACNVRTAGIPLDDSAVPAPVINGFALSEDLMTLFGLWITDGTLQWSRGANKHIANGRIAQTQNGRASAELERLSAVFGMKKYGSLKKRDTTRPVMEEQFCFDWALAQVFHDWAGRYSPDRKLPAFVYSMPSRFRAALFKGLILGDASESGGPTTFRSSSTPLADGLQALGAGLGYTTTRSRNGESEATTFWPEQTERMQACERKEYQNGSTRGHITRTRFENDRLVCFTVPNQTLVTRSGRKLAFHGNSMAAHHVWDGEMPHNLAFVGSLLTDGRYWKDDAKGDGGNLAIPDHTFRAYNLRDILVTQRIAPTLHAELIRLRQWPLYIDELRAAEIMCRASIRGMLIDEERRMSSVIDGTTGKPIGLGPAMVAQRDEAVKMLREVSGDPTFDPARPVKVQELFFNKLHFPVVLKSIKTGAPKVDKEALMLLELLASTREQKVGLRGVIQFRQAEKTLGTFVTGLGKFIHPSTWRFHTQWKLLAVSGRFTSSPNAQNWSTKIKRMFRAAYGYKFVGVDLSQAELRYIAYLANDAALLRMYREGINVHTVNACLLFKIQCPEPKDLNPQTERFLREEMLRIHGIDYSTCAVIALSNWKPVRTLAKNFVFGKNYGAQDETVFKVLRSKRDPDTNKLLFPTLILSEIQALSVMWTKRLHPEIPLWWQSIQLQTRKAGGYFCPISGRSRLFRGGFKQNEMLNQPIQCGVASWMNKAMIEVQDTFDRETGGSAQIIQQVHDALNSEVPDEYVQRAGEVKMEVLNRVFPLLGHNAQLPADKVDVHDYLDKV